MHSWECESQNDVGDLVTSESDIFIRSHRASASEDWSRSNRLDIRYLTVIGP